MFSQLLRDSLPDVQRWMNVVKSTWLTHWPQLPQPALDLLASVLDRAEKPTPLAIMSAALPADKLLVEKHVLPELMEVMGPKATRPTFLLWLSEVNSGDERLESERSQRFLSTEIGYQGVHFRGEHGDPANGLLQTRLGSYTFSSEEAATCYAESPNDQSDIMHTPRLIEANVSCGVLFMEDEEPFVDLSACRHLFEKEDDYVGFALRMASSISHTDNYTETLEELGVDNYSSAENTLKDLIQAHGVEVLDRFYLDAYCVFDDQEIIERIRYHGYDSIIHGGMGVSDGEPEYKTLYLDQIEVVSVQKLTDEGLIPWLSGGEIDAPSLLRQGAKRS